MATKTQRKIAVKNLLVLLGSVLVVVVGILIIFKLAIPILLNCLYIFLALTDLFPLVDINTKFIGGFLFLFIFWHIMCAIIRAGLTLAEIGMEESLERTNKLFKFKL